MFLALDTTLAALLSRLETLSSEPPFEVSSQVALSRALAAYASSQGRVALEPLPEEFALAKLYLYADYRPENGTVPILEWVREDVSMHVPDEERAWLDPLQRSSMDLLEVESLEHSDPASTGWTVALRSLGDGRRYVLEHLSLEAPVQEHHMFLTRLLRHPGTVPQEGEPERMVPAGPLILLANRFGRAVYESTDQWRRELEAESGSFSLGDWQAFVKPFGYVLLWRYAQTRMDALLEAETQTRYQTPAGRLVLYALALYEHHEFRYLGDVLDTLKGWHEESGLLTGNVPCRTWVQREPDSNEVRAKLTLTPSQLQVECESGVRLDDVKHQLAASCGYSLHLRGESSEPPRHPPPEVDLSRDLVSTPSVNVSEEEEVQLLRAFLESVYWDWPDHPCAALGGQTPRHAASSPTHRDKVASLIEERAQTDLVYRRVGQAGYDFHQLRRKVGLDA